MAYDAQWPDKLPTPIAFVGEAPSYEEIEKGLPFVGPAGRIFNSLLRTANLERDDYLVTNVFAEQIPDNKIKNWCMPLKDARGEVGGTDLPPIGSNGFLRMEHRHHLARLADELHRADPAVIVPLGGTALWAFTGASNITSMRGTALEASRTAPGVKVVPTFHPSYLMKKFEHYSIVVRDLQYAKIEADKGKGITYAKRHLILQPTLRDLDDYFDRCVGAPSLSIDIETGWGQITCIGFSWDVEWGLCVPFIDHRKANKSYWESPDAEAQAWKWVKAVCESPCPKVGQNFAGYDWLWCLRKRGIGVRNLADDTRLLSHAIYPELPKDLGFLGSSYASQGAWKYMGKKGDKRDDGNRT